VQSAASFTRFSDALLQKEALDQAERVRQVAGSIINVPVRILVGQVYFFTVLYAMVE